MRLYSNLELPKFLGMTSQVRQEGFAWVQCRTVFDYSDLSDFGRVRTITRQPTEEEQAVLDTLQAELEAIEREIDGHDEDADADSAAGEGYAALEEKYDAAGEKLDSLLQSPAEPDAGERAIAGAVVTIDHDGRLRIERGLIRKEDMKKLCSEKGVAGIAGTVKVDEPIPVHSEKLTRMLTAQRTAAIQAAWL
jgi:ParB family chromosome partitioning protein